MTGSLKVFKEYEQTLLSEKEIRTSKIKRDIIKFIVAVYECSNHIGKYRVSKIKKKSGKYRTIYIPDDEYKRELRKANKLLTRSCKILAARIGNIGVCDYSLVGNKYAARRANVALNRQQDISIFSNNIFVDQNKIDVTSIKNFCLVRIDIKNAFENTNLIICERAIRKTIVEIIEQIESLLITIGIKRGIIIPPDLGTLVCNTLLNCCFVDGKIPTGFPTSTALFNLAFGSLDSSIFTLLRKISYEYEYIRYVDDLNFIVDRQHVSYVIKKIRFFLAGRGYEVNNKKIKVMTEKNGYSLLGYSVGRENPRPNKRIRNKIRMYTYLKNKGIKEAEPKYNGYKGIEKIV